MVVVAGRVLAVTADVVATPATTTNWGAVAPVSRLAWSPVDRPLLVSTRSTWLLPRTSAVTSTLVQPSPATGPEVATIGPGVGALA